MLLRYLSLPVDTDDESVAVWTFSGYQPYFEFSYTHILLPLNRWAKSTNTTTNVSKPPISVYPEPIETALTAMIMTNATIKSRMSSLMVLFTPPDGEHNGS